VVPAVQNRKLNCVGINIDGHGRTLREGVMDHNRLVVPSSISPSFVMRKGTRAGPASSWHEKRRGGLPCEAGASDSAAFIGGELSLKLGVGQIRSASYLRH
jgi:hypothetical protein